MKSTSGTRTAASGSSVRGKYTFVTRLRFAARLMLEVVRADAKYCIGRTLAITSTWYFMPPDGKFAKRAEDDDVDGRREDGTRIAQAMPEERLLVPDDDVAPDERPEQLAEVPELGERRGAASEERAG